MTDYTDLIARAERAIQDARDFTDDKKPSMQITLELLAAVKASAEVADADATKRGPPV